MKRIIVIMMAIILFIQYASAQSVDNQQSKVSSRPEYTLRDLYRIALERSERIKISEQDLFIAEREKISLSECVFVGDNHNDVHVAEIAGLSIAFNCKSESLAEVCDVIVENKDLREVLKYII